MDWRSQSNDDLRKSEVEDCLRVLFWALVPPFGLYAVFYVVLRATGSL